MRYSVITGRQCIVAMIGCVVVAIGTMGVGTSSVYARSARVLSPFVTHAGDSLDDTVSMSRTSPGTSGRDANAPYGRYVYPGECLAMMPRLGERYWRDRREDTLPLMPDRPSLVPGLRDSLAVCASRIQVGQLTEMHLPSMLGLAIAIGSQEVVETTIARISSPRARRDVADQALMFRNTIKVLLALEPVPMTQVKTFVQALERLGPAGAPALAAANAEIVRYALVVGDITLVLDRTESSRRLTGGATMEPADRIQSAQYLMQAYYDGLKGRAVRSGEPALMAWLDTGAREMRQVRDINPGSVQQVFESWRGPYSAIGRPAAPVRATYWYGTDKDTAAYPRAGKVTLLIYGSTRNRGLAFYKYGVLKRLWAKLQGPSFDLVLMTETTGLFINKLVPNPDEEAPLIQRFFQQYVGVPGVLAVEQGRFNTMPNGYRLPSPSMNLKAYPFVDKVADASIVGKDGTIRYVGILEPETERLFETVLREALSR